MNHILELIFKGLLQWLFDMIINITEYLSNSLLSIFTMDLSYFESTVPVTADIVNIMICVGWALMLGNLVFQATKSMVTGLGFEGEDPKELFTRTFVMSFLLVASRQVCDIGLSITKTVIDLLQIPTIVQVPKLTESTFAVPGDASWLLAIIIGIILVVQIVKLFFEIGERYVVVAILTILSPLAFAMGGSKNTADIFKGWTRMFASMCLMMVLSVVFLKLVLSAMAVVPTGAAVVPWAIFVVAIARTGRKVDNIIARIGLNPAVTGDPLGHSRMPGMLTMMVARNIAGNVGKAASVSKGSDSKKPDSSRPALALGTSGHSATPDRPPIGSGKSKDISFSSAPASGGYSAHGTSKSTEAPAYRDPAHTLPAGKETGGIPLSAKDSLSGTMSSKSAPTRPSITSPASSKDKTSIPSSSGGKIAGAGISSAPGKDRERSSTAPTTGSGSLSSAKGLSSSPAASKERSAAHTMAKASTTSDSSTKGTATDAPKASTPIAAKPKADIPTASTAKADIPSTSKARVDMPLADKVRPAASSADKTGAIASRGASERVKTSKDALAAAGSATRPSTTGVTGAKTSAEMAKPRGESAKSPAASRPSDASVVNKTGDVNQKGGNVSQSQTNATNVSVQQKAVVPTKPNHLAVTTAKSKHSRPPVGKVPNISKTSGNINSSKPSPNETSKGALYSSNESAQTAQNKAASEQNTRGSANESYKNISARPENKTAKNNETVKLGGTSGQTARNIGPAASSAKTHSVLNTNNAGATNTTLAQAGISTSSQPSASQGSSSRPASPTTHNPQNHVKGSRPTTTNPSQVQGNKNPASLGSNQNQKKTQTSTGINNENREKLKNRPPYKPSVGNKSNGHKGAEDK